MKFPFATGAVTNRIISFLSPDWLDDKTPFLGASVRPDAFTSRERGEVRKTQTGFWAFHPTKVPRHLPLSEDVVKLLDEATGAVHRLGGVGRLIPNPHLLIGPHLRLEAVLSSRIEGTKTDVGQLLLFEAGQMPSSDDADDAAEVNNYIVAMEHGLERVKGGFPISVRLLREMHELLLADVRGQHRHPGELRTSPVWIGGSNVGDTVFVPPPPEEMRAALSDLEGFLHERELPLLVQLAMAHYQFEAIHPFLDGNGRIGRLLIPLMLVRRDALPQPLLYLSAYFEQHRSEYDDHLLITSQTGDLMPWIASSSAECDSRLATPRSGPSASSSCSTNSATSCSRRTAPTR